MSRTISLLLAIYLAIASGTALADPSGLNAAALAELQDAGVNKYLGTAQSTTSEHGVWTKHDFDPKLVLDASYPSGVRPDGPVCIAGTPYSVFSKVADPKKVLIFMQGGGACW